jgi:transposase InsO family protein
MPWKEMGRMELRQIFRERVATGQTSMTEACREFGISRQCGYKWLRRFAAQGESGLADRSRRPLRFRRPTDPQIERELVEDRLRHPFWGARKLQKRLASSGAVPPSERTVNRILSRSGLIQRPVAEEVALQRFARERPNHLWQMDHKGMLRGKWRSVSSPFVVLDDASRYLLGLWSLPDKSIASTWPCLWAAFGDFGLPEGILSDNAIIFAGHNGPSWIEGHLMRLGIDVLHGRPYHPQTQGKVERLNGTLEREVLRNGVFETAAELQAGFDHFRHRYNFDRPHDALDLEVPARLYVPSPRKRPSAVPEMEYGSGCVLRKVDEYGKITFRGFHVEVGRGIRGERVEVRSGEGSYEVFYGRYRVLSFIPGERVDRSRHYRCLPGRR